MHIPALNLIKVWLVLHKIERINIMCLSTIEGKGELITLLDWFETVKNSKEKLITVPLRVEELPCGCKQNSVFNQTSRTLKIQKTSSGWIHVDPECNKIIIPL